jgi:hypothetical protein
MLSETGGEQAKPIHKILANRSRKMAFQTLLQHDLPNL